MAATDAHIPFELGARELEAGEQRARQRPNPNACAVCSAFVLGTMVATIGLLTVQHYGLGDARLTKFFVAPAVPQVHRTEASAPLDIAPLQLVSGATGAAATLLPRFRAPIEAGQPPASRAFGAQMSATSRREFGIGAVLAATSLMLAPVSSAIADEAGSAGFEEFAAKGGVMKADTTCFFDQCGEQSKACFTNPACLKGITCLGNCRGEQLCATQCFARFGSDKLNAWLACTLEEKECVTTGVKPDTSAFYAKSPPAAPNFKPSDLEGKWYKVLGYNPKYDTYPCQTNTFKSSPDGGLSNEIIFSVPNPKGGPAWQNNFFENLADSKGKSGKASMQVQGKMFGLTFNEDWYSIGKGDGYHIVAYRGDTLQGPYDGAFVFAKEKNFLDSPEYAQMSKTMNSQMQAAGLDPNNMMPIDNTCPASVTAGASATEASKEKLEWRDVFELTEWFRPGTLKKDRSFDPNKM